MSLSVVIFLVIVYGGLITVGGLMWMIGQFLHRDRVTRIGGTTAFLGLCVDGILLITNWMFGWMSTLLEKT